MKRAVVFFGALAVTAAGCLGPLRGDAKPKSDYPLEEVASRPGPALYYVGDSFAGLPLTAIVGARAYPSFIYGACEIENQGWFQDGGCPPPLSIQHESTASYKAKLAQLDPSVTCIRTTVRGVPAATIGGGLRVFTRETAITIYADAPGQARRAAEALRPVGGSAPADGDLPQPPRWIDDALRRCKPS
jgi:hypothetical protein